MQGQSKVEASRKRAKTGGRVKGTPNKLTKTLKESILEAAEKAGGPAGTVGYLTTQASANPTAFMGLLGKVLPMQIAGADNEDGTPGEIIVRILDPRING